MTFGHFASFIQSEKMSGKERKRKDTLQVREEKDIVTYKEETQLLGSYSVDPCTFCLTKPSAVKVVMGPVSVLWHAVRLQINKLLMFIV